MHKCWEVILEMEIIEVILKGEHIPLMYLWWLKPHIPPSPSWTLFLANYLTYLRGHKKMRMQQSLPKVPTSAMWELESGDKTVASVSTSHHLCLRICNSRYYKSPVSISHDKNTSKGTSRYVRKDSSADKWRGVVNENVSDGQDSICQEWTRQMPCPYWVWGEAALLFPCRFWIHGAQS